LNKIKQLDILGCAIESAVTDNIDRFYCKKMCFSTKDKMMKMLWKKGMANKRERLDLKHAQSYHKL